MGHNTYVIDFDGTISRDSGKPDIQIIEKVNLLFEAGHTILINSSAAWARYGNIKKWLEDHNVKYHDLILGRPWGNYYVDDKMLSLEDFILKGVI